MARESGGRKKTFWIMIAAGCIVIALLAAVLTFVLLRLKASKEETSRQEERIARLERELAAREVTAEPTPEAAAPTPTPESTPEEEPEKEDTFTFEDTYNGVPYSFTYPKSWSGKVIFRVRTNENEKWLACTDILNNEKGKEKGYDDSFGTVFSIIVRTNREDEFGEEKLEASGKGLYIYTYEPQDVEFFNEDPKYKESYDSIREDMQDVVDSIRIGD